MNSKLMSGDMEIVDTIMIKINMKCNGKKNVKIFYQNKS